MEEVHKNKANVLSPTSTLVFVGPLKVPYSLYLQTTGKCTCCHCPACCLLRPSPCLKAPKAPNPIQIRSPPVWVQVCKKVTHAYQVALGGIIYMLYGTLCPSYPIPSKLMVADFKKYNRAIYSCLRTLHLSGLSSTSEDRALKDSHAHTRTHTHTHTRARAPYGLSTEWLARPQGKNDFQ